MDNSNESYEINLTSSVKKKYIFIGIIFLILLLRVTLFNSANPIDLSLHIKVTEHVQNSTKNISSTFTSTTVKTTTSTSKLTPATAKITPSSSPNINFDDILCDNLTEFKTMNISQNPCERIRCSVILRSSGGRLGNRMFMFASAYGLTRTHNCRLHVSKSILNELSGSFQMKLIDNKMWLSQEELHNLKNIQSEYSVCNFLPKLLILNSFKNIELTGYWQSYLYFDAYREEIREIFSARNDTLIRLAEYFTNIIKDICPLCLPLPNTTHKELRQAFQTRYNTTWISIHIRRNDFLGLGFSSDDDYIRRAITFFRRRYYQYQVIFIVASDDKNYCQKLFSPGKKFGRIIILPNHFSPADDLMALSLCHHSIVTGGTYGFWSAYLTGGEVIHDVRYKAGCLRSDYYPPWFILVGSVVEKKD
jgi:galactoside 2-L-fucosyltransferase 1/2